MALDPYKGKIRCPQCGYPLLGLPPVHSCPECGLNYDPYSRLFVIGRGRTVKASVIFAAILNVVTIFILFRVRLRMEAIPLLIPCVLMFIWSIRASRPAVSRVLIDRFGIHFEHRCLPVAFIPWTQFGKARMSWATGLIRICDPADRILTQLSRYQIRPRTLAHSCVGKMNELAAIYASIDLTPEADHSATDHQPQK